jgi:hypothetical protein
LKQSYNFNVDSGNIQNTIEFSIRQLAKEVPGPF